MIKKIAVLTLLITLAYASVTCKDEHGNNVDWWIILKFPKLRSSTSPNAVNGYGYSYADANSPVLKNSGTSLDVNINGALGSTLNQIYNGDMNSIGYLMYNDQTPDNKEHTSNGHSKGNLAFDSLTGFWLVHSAPRFPYTRANKPYSYPSYATDYGQSFICVSYNYNTFNTIGTQLQTNQVYVYDSNLPSSLAGGVPNIQALLNGQLVKEIKTSIVNLTSIAGNTFTSFAKSKQWDKDLYEFLVQPYWQLGMKIETWMNGAESNKMPTFCTPQYSYNSINIRELAVDSSVAWKETQDHSKWTVAFDRYRSTNLFCIGDINRQFSQAKRGGGTICAVNSGIFKSLSAMITASDSC